MLYDEYETMSLKNFYRENLEKENRMPLLSTNTGMDY